MLTKEVSRIIQLVKENCPPDEAAELIETLVGERIRLHNIQMLRSWEGNHRFDPASCDQKIVEMKAQSKNARTFLKEAKELGFNVEVSATIELRLVKKPFTHNVKVELTNN
ncbi:MAG: hypothetical protein MUC59_15005 [Saprospiraceae bacterium]|jgi:hypothetical protein|nr:hypothetical protein [Saprospiraceae bacterium]